MSSPPALSPYRYLILLSFSLLTLVNSWLWITWSPLEASLTELWGVSDDAVNQLSSVFMFSYVLFGLPGLYLLDKKGLKWGLRAGAVLTFLGACVRAGLASSASRPAFLAAYAGSGVAALGQLFTLAIPPLLSASWFGSDERALATGCGVTANQVGTAVGLGLTPVLVPRIGLLGNFLVAQAVVCGAVMALVFVVVEDRPGVAPSKSAAGKVELREGGAGARFADYLAVVRELLGRSSTRWLAVAYGLSTGVFYS
jgi:FLVCR family feline leukemia virus subgroup C receptor-related protein